MPHSFGYRGRTRHLFKKDFKTKGRPNTTTFLRTYKVESLLDIVFICFNLRYSAATMWILKSTRLSTKVCPSSTTTAELVLFST